MSTQEDANRLGMRSRRYILAGLLRRIAGHFSSSRQFAHQRRLHVRPRFAAQAESLAGHCLEPDSGGIARTLEVPAHENPLNACGAQLVWVATLLQAT